MNGDKSRAEIVDDKKSETINNRPSGGIGSKIASKLSHRNRQKWKKDKPRTEQDPSVLGRKTSKGVCTSEQATQIQENERVAVELKQKVCHFHMRGYCVKGSECKFSHIDKAVLDTGSNSSAKNGPMPVSFTIDDRRKMQLKRLFPGYTFISTGNKQDFSHPMTAIERRLAEDAALKMLENMGHSSVASVGASPHRNAHQSMSMHSINPIYSPSDVVRNARYAGTKNWCACDPLLCTHVKAKAWLLVNAVHRFTPMQLLQHMVSKNIDVIISIHYQWGDIGGSLFEGEGVYDVLDNDVIVARWGRETYTFDSHKWLSLGYFSDGARAIAWNSIAGFNHTEVVMFVHAPTGMTPLQTEHKELFTNAMRDMHYFGGVDMRGLNFLTRDVVNPNLDAKFIEQMLVVSVGEHCFLQPIGEKIRVKIPKSTVHEVAAFIAGKPRSSDNFASAIECAKKSLKEVNLDYNHRALAIMYAAVFGYVLHVETEMNLMTQVLQPMKQILRHHERTLKFEFPRMLPHWGWLLFVILLVLVVSALILFEPSFVWGEFVDMGVFSFYHVQFLLFMVIVGFIFWIFKRCGAAMMLNRALEGYRQYSRTRQSFDIENNVVHHQPVKLPGTTFHAPHLVLDDDAKISEPSVLDDTDKDKLTSVGIVLTTNIPLVLSNNEANVSHGLKKRYLAKMPDPEPEVLQRYRHFVFDNLDTLFPDMKQVVRDPDEMFELWNARFPQSQQQRHTEARERVRGFNVLPKRFLRTKTHGKCEKLLLSDVFGVSEKAQRVIQAHTDEYNVTVGPWMYAFSKELMECWNSQHFLYYYAGSTPDKLGQWFDDTIRIAAISESKSPVVLFMNDFSDYDGSQQLPLLQVEFEIYQHFGMPAVAADAMQRMYQPTRGCALGTIFYEVEGRRHSGEPATSVGNTMNDGLSHAFIICDTLKLSCDKVPPMVLMGDDNGGIGHAEIFEAIQWKEEFAKLGLKSKPKTTRDKNSFEFCQMRPWPAHADGADLTVFGGKPGRIIPKGGWSMDFQGCSPEQIKTHVRGYALGLIQDNAHVPILNQYLRRLLDLTEGAKDVVVILDKHKPHASRSFEMGADTVLMASEIYGWSKVDFDNWQAMLDKVTTLPAALSFDPMKRVVEADT